MKIDLYKGGIDNIKSANFLTLLEVVQLIKNGTYQEQILKIRSLKTKEERSIYKKKLDYVTFGGTFKKRYDNELITSSGLLTLDIDDVTNIEETFESLKKSEYTRLLFRSPSGTGFKVIIQTPPVQNDFQYKEYWNAVKEYYEKLSCPIDDSGSNISRACFLSYDPDLYYNCESKIWAVKEKIKVFNIVQIENELVDVIVPVWVSPNRQKLAMFLSAVLRQKGFGTNDITSFITEIMSRTGDKDVKERLSTVKSTFEKNEENIKGYSGLKSTLEPGVYKTVCRILNHELQVEKKKYELKHVTSHIPHYNTLHKSLGLYGKEYDAMKKALCYHMIGNSIETPNQYINYNGTMFDTRISLGIFMNSGDGKNDINRVCSNTLPSLQTASNVLSLHPEQLVGKSFVTKKDESVVHNKGYLDDDELIFDEGRHFFMKPKPGKEGMMNEIRGYMCTALNPMGQNLVCKRSVDQFKNQKLEYYPKCSVIFLTQPVTIYKDVIESGFLRRLLLVSTRSSMSKTDIFRKRVLGEDKTPFTVEYSNFLSDLSESVENESWVFDGIGDDLVMYASMLVSYGTLHSEKASQYMTKVFSQTAFDMLLKFACIVAVYSRGSKHVTCADLRVAYMDLFEILQKTFDCIDVYAEDFYSYDMDYNELLCLRWLKGQKSVNVTQLTSYLSGLYGCHMNTAVRYYSVLVSKKFLRVSYGKTDAVVVLTSKSLDLLRSESFVENDYFYEEYLEVCEENENGKRNV